MKNNPRGLLLGLRREGFGVVKGGFENTRVGKGLKTPQPPPLKKGGAGRAGARG